MLLSPVVRRLIASTASTRRDPGHRARRPHHPQRRPRLIDRQGGAARRRPRPGGRRLRRPPGSRLLRLLPSLRPLPPLRRRPRSGPAARAGADEVIPFDNIRRRTAEHMVRSKATSPTCSPPSRSTSTRVDRARGAHRAEWKATRGLLPHLPPVHGPGGRRRAARVPARQRQRRRRPAARPPPRQPRHRRRPRLRGPHRRRSSTTPTASASASCRGRSATSPSGPAARS